MNIYKANNLLYFNNLNNDKVFYRILSDGLFVRLDTDYRLILPTIPDCKL